MGRLSAHGSNVSETSLCEPRSDNGFFHHQFTPSQAWESISSGPDNALVVDLAEPSSLPHPRWLHYLVMCGRYTLTNPSDLAARFGLGAITETRLEPRFNIAPAQLA